MLSAKKMVLITNVFLFCSIRFCFADSQSADSRTWWSSVFGNEPAPVKIYVSFGPESNFQAHSQEFVTYVAGLGAVAAGENKWKYEKKTATGTSFFEIHLISSKDDFISALKTKDAYVAYLGHSHFGIGYNWTGNESSYDGNYLKVGTATAAPNPLRYTSSFFLNSQSTVASSPINYITSLNLERYVNKTFTYTDPSNNITTTINCVGKTSPQNSFSILYHCNTTLQFHYCTDDADNFAPYELKDVFTGHTAPRLIYTHCNDDVINGLQYKWLLLSSCESGRYYGDSFQHGTVFYTENGGDVDVNTIKTFVKDVIDGSNGNNLLNDLQELNETAGYSSKSY